jgi:hypothetical protein
MAPMRREPVEVRSGRFVEQSFVLTVATLILLTPPLLTIFDVRVVIFGIPLLHIYSFAVWLVAIVCGRYLATRLNAQLRDAPPSTPPEQG